MFGLRVASEVHIHLRDVLLCQPNVILENPVTTTPWLEPPFAAPTPPRGLVTPLDPRTLGWVVDLLKARFRPAPIAGKKPKEMRWVTTCLTSDPTEETISKYSDREACASLYGAVDILTHHDGIRHLSFEGHTSTAARGILILIAISSFISS